MYQNNSPFQRRNGSDHLSVFLIAAAVIIAVIGSVIDNEAVRAAIDAVALAMAIYSSFRMLSRNIAKRRAENDRFLSIFGKKANYSDNGSSYNNPFSNNSYSSQYRNATPTGDELKRAEKERKAKEKEEKARIKKERKESKKLYKYYKCPKCKTELRVPKGKGKIKIKCPKCQEQFIKRT